MAVLMIASGCSRSDDLAESDDVAQPTALAEESPQSMTGIDTEVFGQAGGELSAGSTTVSVGESASSSDIEVTVLEPADFPAYEIWGNPVRIEHDDPIDKPIAVEWDVSQLDERQRETLLLVHWDDEFGAWLVEEPPYALDGDVLRIETTVWSAWAWTTEAWQEAQELLGRRVDPPVCSGEPLPDWVQAFVDPGENTSAASLLACVEPDRSNQDIVRMRIVNNRTFAQLVTVGGEDPLGRTTQGELPLSPVAIVHQLGAAALNEPNRVLVPPLQEVIIGIPRPTSGIRNQYVELSAEVTGATLLNDVLAFGIAQTPALDLLAENPMVSAFLELLIDCGMTGLVDLDEDPVNLVATVAGVIVDCVKKLSDYNSELGRQLRQLVAERIVSLGSPEEAEKALKSNRRLQSLSKVLRALAAAEAVLYLGDLVQEDLVGNLVWSLNLDGKTREPGDWVATCTDVSSDRMAWNRNWVPQPAFYVGEKRDYHEYPEFTSILTQATSPLGVCSAEHIEAVRALVAETYDQAPDTFDQILDIFDDLIAAAAPAPEPADSAGAYAMPPVCELPAASWIDKEHPNLEGATGTGTVSSIVTGDVTGDGVDDELWQAWCTLSGASPSPAGVHAFGPDGARLGHLPLEHFSGGGAAVATEMSVRSDGEIIGTLAFWQPQDPTCCPSGEGPFGFRWSGTEFVPSSPTTTQPATTLAQTTTSAPPTTATTVLETTTTSETTAPPPPANVTRRFAALWTAGDFDAMAEIASPGAIAVAREWFEPGGEGFPCTDQGAATGQCQMAFAPPDYFAILFNTRIEASDAGPMIVSLDFAGTAG